MRLDDRQTNFIKLILRSEDVGDGWRQCSDVLYEHFLSYLPEELVEWDHDQKRVRLTREGDIVARYL